MNELEQCTYYFIYIHTCYSHYGNARTKCIDFSKFRQTIFSKLYSKYRNSGHFHLVNKAFRGIHWCNELKLQYLFEILCIFCQIHNKEYILKQYECLHYFSFKLWNCFFNGMDRYKRWLTNLFMLIITRQLCLTNLWKLLIISTLGSNNNKVLFA